MPFPGEILLIPGAAQKLVTAPAWTSKAQKVLLPLVALDLVIQYIAGALTNAYAPAAGFNQNTSFGVYDVHWLNGYVLGVLLIVTLIVVALSRQHRNLAIVVVSFIGFLSAAVSGMAYINSSPNNPVDTSIMAISFLVAFIPIQVLTFHVMMGGESPPSDRMVSPPHSTAS
jgi:hypothetical protein